MVYNKMIKTYKTENGAWIAETEPTLDDHADPGGRGREFIARHERRRP